jgi:four helix bundle protein
MLGAATVSEQADQLQERTFRFALDVIELTKTLPTMEPGPTIRRQLTKSATSIGANYRAGRRARSHAEFTAKIGVVAEEADESVYWLDVVSGAKLTTSPELPKLRQESRELTAIFSRAAGTARLNARSR